MLQSEISSARYFADLPDPCVDRTKWHRLDDILVILCVIRRVAASLLEQDTKRGRIKAERRNTEWNQNYHKQVLQGFKNQYMH